MLYLLNFCRFMYYLMKNAQYLDVNEVSRDKIKIVLFKNSIQIIKQLLDFNTNWFNFQGWEEFKITNSYKKMMGSFTEYLSKY